jgi:hypothetical protein
MGQVADGKGDVAEPAISQLMDNHVQDGLIADREEGLGEDGGVRAEAGALAARQDDGSTCHCCFCRHSSQKVEFAAYACSPMRILWKALYWLAVLAISVVLLVVLMMWFESRDASKVQGSAVERALA